MNLLHENADRWRGMRYVALVRQSSTADGTNSTEAQLRWMHAEGEALGMTLVEDVELSGVTGSIPGNRKDLDRLFNRKYDKDDFDVLMIQRIDRATRSGPQHGFWFEQECARHGIEVMYPGEDLPDNEDHAVWAKVAKFQSAKEQARAISQRSTQGWLLAFSQNRALPIGRTPYGCDRLYFCSEGKPQFRIRNLPDGSQVKLDVEANQILERYSAEERYRKQKSQLPVIVPGERVAAESVYEMFHLHYQQDWGGKRIADRLNRKGITSPMGKGWSQRQVESIYENPIYCGFALGSRSSQGIYNRRGQMFPEAIHVSAIELAKVSAAPRKLRPPEDWVWVGQEPMKAFLPADLSAIALPQIKQAHQDRWLRSQDADRPKRSTSKHKDSVYILTGLLIDNEFGEPLTGVLCGKVGKKVRKYRHRRGRLGYIKGSKFNNYIRAAALESAVLDVILELLRNRPDLEQRIAAAIEQEQNRENEHANLADLQKQRDALARQFQRIASLMTDDDQTDIKPVLENLRTQRRELDAQIEKILLRGQLASNNKQALTEQVMGNLNQLPDDTSSLDTAAQRRLLQAFVEKVEVDMATRNAEVFLKLPPWAMKTALVAAGEGRPANSSPSPTVDETPPPLSVRLALADCQYVHDRSKRTACYSCRRRAA